MYLIHILSLFLYMFFLIFFRHLLICFLWVLKNVDKPILKQWWIELPHNRLQTLLEVLRITLSCFQYKVTWITDLSRCKVRQCTDVRFACFLSGGFTNMEVINPPERKLAKRTFVCNGKTTEIILPIRLHVCGQIPKIKS